MERLGAQLNTVEKTYQAALGKISSGKGNLVRQVEQFRELGAHVKKPLPKAVIEASESDDHPDLTALASPEIQVPQADAAAGWPGRFRARLSRAGGASWKVCARSRFAFFRSASVSRRRMNFTERACGAI